MALEKLSGKVVKKGKDVDLSEFDVVGLYFSAHWCPPCRGFTPELAKFYETPGERAPGTKFEIVFISSDRDQGSFDEYYGEMPWAALKFDERDTKTELAGMFQVRGIPTLVILDGKTGETLDAQARNTVMEMIDAKDFNKDKWGK
ncbi:uncharacterized protein LOC127865975 [Dreissena polymorpha]|uniref:protein-disulfide reductase n=1 Tax=Dreissena polymorpha TaxID=45954 RepID=A0A9D4RAY4_DREPO|nr:uncharacterized protein LOC127865975 [Dreissena polymorpha]KAH3861539.1 hypothetical protein DPMN_024471 [Dreissena polymorpha]